MSQEELGYREVDREGRLVFAQHSPELDRTRKRELQIRDCFRERAGLQREEPRHERPVGNVGGVAHLIEGLGVVAAEDLLDTGDERLLLGRRDEALEEPDTQLVL